MNITVVGFGAVGGMIGFQLAAAGYPVNALARGATLEALKSHGARMQGRDGMGRAPVRAEQDPTVLGVQDLVIIAVKATALHDVAARIAPLVGPETTIVAAMNGVPWWFFEGNGVPYAGAQLPSLDPDGALLRAMPLAQVIGCVVHLSSSCPQPGVVQPGFGNRLILGEPSGAMSARLSTLVTLLRNAGFDAPVSGAIRSDIWYKLWGNMTINPVSALTGATCDAILDDVLVYRFCLAAMQEAATIGAKIGCPIAQTGPERLEVARGLGKFRTSMLQDAQAGRALEIDALVTSVHDIGRMVGIPTPNIDTLLGLVRLYGRVHGVYS